MTVDLAPIRARMAAVEATGPIDLDASTDDEIGAYWEARNDLRVNASADVPALVAEVERLRTVLAEVERVLADGRPLADSVVAARYAVRGTPRPDLEPSGEQR